MLVVRADVPGGSVKDIEVTAELHVLTIRGERVASEPTARNGFASIERGAGASRWRMLRARRAADDDGWPPAPRPDPA